MNLVTRVTRNEYKIHEAVFWECIFFWGFIFGSLQPEYELIAIVIIILVVVVVVEVIVAVVQIKILVPKIVTLVFSNNQY